MKFLHKQQETQKCNLNMRQSLKNMNLRWNQFLIKIILCFWLRFFPFSAFLNFKVKNLHNQKAPGRISSIKESSIHSFFDSIWINIYFISLIYALSPKKLNSLCFHLMSESSVVSLLASMWAAAREPRDCTHVARIGSDRFPVVLIEDLLLTVKYLNFSFNFLWELLPQQNQPKTPSVVYH